MGRYPRVVYRICAVALACVPMLACSQGVPVWQRLLRWGGGPSSETPVDTMMMGEHMQMSVRREARSDDSARADAIVEGARRVLERYADVAKAEAAGYRAFAPRGVIGEEVHYTNMWVARRERKTLDLKRPGSILYVRTATGMKAVGVMYTADVSATTEELEARAPLGVAEWHRHVRICGWPNGTAQADYDGPGARFGFAGSISTESACDAAGGYWIPVAFGWMTHVYPNEADPANVWLGHSMRAQPPGAMHDGHHDHR